MPDKAIIEPPPRSINSGTAAFVRRKAPSNATDKISRHSEKDISRNFVCRRKPALQINISSPPRSFFVLSIRVLTEMGSDISAIYPTAFPPFFFISATVSETRPSLSRPFTTIVAPDADKLKAMPRPIF